uniref:Uncharacterized protein n=1 Tax=Candidatus Kentrum sp. LPFa TaxID=2126335 RepID=A0A450VNP4_9GAMM|nr:MAG: hypothetical protein BECKLPF1236A_GA0070988_100037 [Candidatus Kentron sp. LPFa]VFK22838.1 MAG: hypothetical protein BECKLPF1236C_GA0070990_100027 [Candidatus Kentron sp. LPFa]
MCALAVYGKIDKRQAPGRNKLMLWRLRSPRNAKSGVVEESHKMFGNGGGNRDNNRAMSASLHGVEFP